MGRRSLGRSLPPAAAIVAGLAFAAPAAALDCGARGQPVCTETAPPGEVLTPPPGGNPYNLQPLSTPPSGGTPLWPEVRGHKPYGLHATSAGRSGTTIADEVYLHGQFGGSITRIGADWAGIQYYPNTAEGGRPWDYETYLDNQYLAYVKAGIRPILDIIHTPRRFTTRWNTSNGSAAPGCGPTNICWAPPRSDVAGRLGVFAADLAKRYPLAAGIEVWNEPNLSNPFWGTDTPNPEYYASLLNIVHDAVKGVRPNMPVIGGGLMAGDVDSTQNGYPVLSMRTFVRRMLNAGAQPNMDAISFHPYLGRFTGNSTLMYRMTQGSAQLVSAYGDSGKAMGERLVLTETGASTTNGWTHQKQSDWLSYQFHLVDTSASTLPLSGRTDAMIVHEAVENLNPAGGSWQTGYGLLKVKDGAGRFVPKQAFCTFRTLWGGFSTCPAYFDPPG